MPSPTPSSSSSLAPNEMPPPHTDSLNTHFNAASSAHESKHFRLTRRPTRNSTLQRWPGWEVGGQREPYHAYVHQLVAAGWDNLKPLDDYMCQDVEDKDLVISVLDILEGDVLKRHDDYHDEAELKAFLREDKREGVKVRLILAEQQGPGLSSGVVEALGGSLKLDPRFFQWNVFGNKHLLSPSERHRAPFTSIGFTVPNERTQAKTDTEFFRVSIYVQPDAVGDGWTGEKRKWFLQR